MPNKVNVKMVSHLQDAVPLMAFAVEQKVKQAALAIESEAKRVCPVDTGRLRASIHTEFDEAGLSAQVGTDVSYAAPVELGHVTRSGSWVPPQPYLQPAALAARGYLEMAPWPTAELEAAEAAEAAKAAEENLAAGEWGE